MTFRFVRNPAAVAFGVILLAATAPAQNTALSTQTPYGGDVVDGIIARVNDQIITSSDYDRAMNELDQEDQQRGDTMQEMSEDRKNLLRSLIDQQLWLSKGKELGITGDIELVKRLDDIRKQYHLSSIEDLEKAAKEQGVSFEDFKAQIRNQIITQDVMRQEVGSTIEITPGEARQYYEEHKQDYTQPESEHLSEILVSTGAPAADGTEDQKKVDAARAKAENIEAKLHAGGDFAQLARTFSDGPTAAGGGDLGQYKRGQLPKELEDKTFSLQPGQWTEPILTRQGWIILKVTQHTAAGPAPYKDVENQVEDSLYMSMMEPAIRAYLTKMREQAYIDIKPGYVDTGASPNETEPVYSAYVPPSPKKKPKVERTRFRETARSFRQKSPQSAPDETARSQEDKKSGKKTDEATEKPGKKEKIRFGQKPRETLPSAATDASTGPTVENAGALPETAANTQEPVNPLDTAPVEHKMRYSDLARDRKHHKGKKSAKGDTFTATPPSAGEVADRETQSAPLGLAGDTADKKKKKHTATGEKTRYSEQSKKAAEENQPKPTFTPAPPVEGAPAPANAPQQ